MKTLLLRILTCVVTFLAGFAGVQKSHADEIVTFVDGSIGYRSNYTYGYTFTVGNSPISVSQLGIWTPTNGLTLDHEVGLWDESQNLLASVTVFGGGLSPLYPSSFSYEPIGTGPVYLNPNTTYRLGAQYYLNDPDANVVQATIISSPDIVFGSEYFSLTFTLGFPDQPGLFPSGSGYFGPNAEFQIVPEPTIGAIMCLGLLILARSRRAR